MYVRRLVLALLILLNVYQPVWPQGSLVESSLLLDIAEANGTYVAVGERGHILASRDGKSWLQVDSSNESTLTAVDLFHDGLGFAVGHDAIILRTHDGGRSWNKVFSAIDEQRPLLDVMIVNKNRIVAIGAYGYYLESSDGGSQWRERILEIEYVDDNEEVYNDFHLNDLHVAIDGKWYIAAEAGNIYRSDDQGETWLRLPSPYTGSFYGIISVSPENLFVFGLQGRLYQSKDSGETWKPVDTNTQSILTHGLKYGDKQVLILGHAGTILTDVKIDESPRLVHVKDRVSFSSALMVNDDELLTVGDQGIKSIRIDIKGDGYISD